MENETLQKNNPYAIPAAIVIAGIFISGALLYNQPKALSPTTVSQDENIFPKAGVILPVSWGDLGAKLVSVGAIDEEKFQALYEERGQFTCAFGHKYYIFTNRAGNIDNYTGLFYHTFKNNKPHQKTHHNNRRHQPGKAGYANHRKREER